MAVAIHSRRSSVTTAIRAATTTMTSRLSLIAIIVAKYRA
jgi:hypothetical protein